MANSTPIFPFAKPDAPPPPVIVLLDATELHVNPPTSLLAFEDLRPASFKKVTDHAAARRLRFHPYNHRETTIDPSDRHLSPRPTHPATLHPPASLPSTSPGDLPSVEDPLDMSPLSSPESSPRSSPVPDSSQPVSFCATSTKIKIERPKGAARRNLLKQVKWDPAFLAEVRKQTRRLVHEHLDHALCFKDQEQGKLDAVRKEMLEKFPRLDDYENLWPLDIIIMSLLKYSLSHGKGVSHKIAVDAVRDFVGSTASNTGRPRRSAVNKE